MRSAMKARPVELISVADAKHLAQAFKERAQNDPEAVAARKEWGNRVVEQIVTGLGRFQREKKFPAVY